MILPLRVAFRASRSSDGLIASELLNLKNSTIACAIEVQKASVDNKDVLLLHCGRLNTATGESHLKSSKNWSMV